MTDLSKICTDLGILGYAVSYGRYPDHPDPDEWDREAEVGREVLECLKACPKLHITSLPMKGKGDVVLISERPLSKDTIKKFRMARTQFLKEGLE